MATHRGRGPGAPDHGAAVRGCPQGIGFRVRAAVTSALFAAGNSWLALNDSWRPARSGCARPG